MENKLYNLTDKKIQDIESLVVALKNEIKPRSNPLQEDGWNVALTEEQARSIHRDILGGEFTIHDKGPDYPVFGVVTSMGTISLHIAGPQKTLEPSVRALERYIKYG